MKKLLLSLLAVIAVGAVAWYLRGDLDISQPSVTEKMPEEKVIVKQGQPILDNKEVLKAAVAEIISRPIMVSAPLSESNKKRALDKIKEITDLIEKDYNFIYPWYDLGAYRRIIGDFEGAAEAWTFATLIRPNDFVSYHNLGDLYGFYVKDYPKSEENYLKSIQLNPQNIQAYLDLALIYGSVYKEKSNQVESILLQGLKVNPDNPGLKTALEQVGVK